MEIKKEEKINDNGSYSEGMKVTTTKDDGWINDCKVNTYKDTNGIKVRKKLFKGDATSYHYETNNPRITRLITIIFSGVAVLIGIALLLIGIFNADIFMFFFGFIFFITIVMFFINSQKEINKVKEDLKEEKKNK